MDSMGTFCKEEKCQSAPRARVVIRLWAKNTKTLVGVQWYLVHFLGPEAWHCVGCTYVSAIDVRRFLEKESEKIVQEA